MTEQESDNLRFDLSMMLSCQRTVDDLHKALAKALSELFVSQDYRLYINSGSTLTHDFYLYSHSEHVFDAEADIDEIHCFDISEAVFEERGLTFFPGILDESFLACLVVPQHLDPERERQLVCLMTIYCNVLSLISDSRLDGLTGLMNRKSFDNELLVEIGKSTDYLRRKGDTFDDELHSYLAIVDIDHFKRVNDTHGHLIGDEVLLRLAQLIKESFREVDGLYRYGGEEFAVILRQLSIEDAQHVLQRFCDKIRTSTFPTVGHITISIGFCHIHDRLTSTTAIAEADKALYYSKEHGRDQISNYHALVAKGQIVESEIDTDIELF